MNKNRTRRVEKVNSWNELIQFLMSAEEGDWADNEGRTVEAAFMAGGKYLLTDESGHVRGLTNDLMEACNFLRYGHLGQ